MISFSFNFNKRRLHSCDGGMREEATCGVNGANSRHVCLALRCQSGDLTDIGRTQGDVSGL